MIHKTPFLISLDWNVDDIGIITTSEACRKVGGNTGNLAFCYAIARHLDLTRQKPLTWNSLPDAMKGNDKLCGVFAMANVLGPHVNLASLANEYKDFLGRLVVLGIGAQASLKQVDIEIPDGSLQFLKTVAGHSLPGKPNISVRGDFTRKLLAKHGLADHCIALGCPSLFINPSPKLGALISSTNEAIKPSTVAICAGHYRWTHLACIERRLVGLVDAHHGKYIVQSPLEMLALASNEIDTMDASTLQECRSFIHRDLDLPDFRDWCRNHVESYYSAPEWMHALKKKQFVVGYRIHGVMLALQAGTPGLCFVHDSRTLELCQKMMIPYLTTDQLGDSISLEYLWGRFWDLFDPIAFDENRKELAHAYSQLLYANGLQVSSCLTNIYS